MSVKRRDLLLLVCWSLALSLAPAPRGLEALARDGGDRSGKGGGGDDSGRGGGGNSGPGGGDDRGGDDNRGDDNNDDRGGDDRKGRGSGDDDDAKDDDGSKGGTSRSRRSGRGDQERARAAVAEGRILPLKDVLRLVDERQYGTVIAVDLKRYAGRDVYRLRTRNGAGAIRNYRIDAHTGRFINIFGF